MRMGIRRVGLGLWLLVLAHKGQSSLALRTTTGNTPLSKHTPNHIPKRQTPARPCDTIHSKKLNRKASRPGLANSLMLTRDLLVTRTTSGTGEMALDTPQNKTKKTMKQRILTYLSGGGSFDRKRMAALGLGCLLSYGFVSNINVGVITAVAWASFSKQTGLSPLAEGQWLKFVAVQVGIYAVVGNLLRPVRLALAVSVAPMFNKAIAFLQNKLQVSKGLAVFLNVVLFNVIINISFMCTGIWIASKLVGVPAIPPGRLPEWVPSWVT
ncbi:hypothetical protein AAMO2058_001579800 [Amorphochlora amoebiformis]